MSGESNKGKAKEITPAAPIAPTTAPIAKKGFKKAGRGQQTGVYELNPPASQSK